jgi:hypothetical protein
MRRLLHFFQNLFGAAPEDHLMGAVDLSDAAYCLGLLSSKDDC